MNYIDVKPIPIRERASILFVEHAQIDVSDQAFVLINADGTRTAIPAVDPMAIEDRREALQKSAA